MGRAASGERRTSSLAYVAAILAAGAALSRYGLGSLWHPPANSPFGVPSQREFSRAVDQRLPGAAILVYRQIDGTAVAVAAQGPSYSILEGRYNADHSLQVTGQSEQQAGGAPVSVTQVWNRPAVLVAYVSDAALAQEAASAAVRWSNGAITHIDLGDRPRAWIVPPPTASPAGGQPEWQRIVLFDRYARPIAVVEPASTTWLPPAPALAPGAFTMPRSTAF
ncbi:MAG: hypothetical protein K6V73_07520 [Firmicutes bacterium]|nr:hypothetical protein [Bacillota bacterium]